LLRGKVAVLLAAVLLEFISGAIWHCLDMRTGAAFVAVAMGLSLAVKIGLRWWSYSIASRDNFGKKTSKVTVVRDG
jgi:hypothetical protein